MLSALLLAAAPVTIATSAQHVDFRYAWPREAAAVPALDRRFRADAARRLRELRSSVADERRMRRQAGALLTDMRYSFSRIWETAGRTGRLLSLEQATATYTGGAHGNRGTQSLLWDLPRAREVTLNALLLRPGWWDGAVRAPFCTLLDRERTRRREAPVRRGEWPNQCPELKELTLTLEDEDRDRRFDHVRITADPYVAGAYAEGDYVINLPITAGMVARLRPEYRASFEAQPPVQ